MTVTKDTRYALTLSEKCVTFHGGSRVIPVGSILKIQSMDEYGKFTFIYETDNENRSLLPQTFESTSIEQILFLSPDVFKFAIAIKDPTDRINFCHSGEQLNFILNLKPGNQVRVPQGAFNIKNEGFRRIFVNYIGLLDGKVPGHHFIVSLMIYDPEVGACPEDVKLFHLYRDENSDPRMSRCSKSTKAYNKRNSSSIFEIPDINQDSRNANRDNSKYSLRRHSLEMSQSSDVSKKFVEQLYLDKEQSGDVTFIVETDRIRAHKCVLVVLSTKYRAQFYGTNQDKGDVEIRNISSSSFKEFLKLFFAEAVNLSVENIEGVLDLAKQSLVDDLFHDCGNFLMENCPLNKMCWCYRLAILYDIKELRNFCEKIINKNTTTVISSVDFMECDQEVLRNILKMDTVNCKETEIFNTCIKWARNTCQQKQLNDQDVTNLRTVLGDVLYQIRFGSMSVEQFTILHKLHEGLFSYEESIEIFYIIGKLPEFGSAKFNQNQRILISERDLSAISVFGR